jgi:hypothetical protein
MENSETNLPEELELVSSRLRAGRPQLSAIEADELRRRVRLRVQGGSTRQRSRRERFMKSRMLVTMMLVFGLVLSTAGAGLAVSGSSDSGSASSAQYAQDQQNSGTLGEVDTVQPSQEESGVTGTQAPRQVAASGGSLPFTGFTAIPVLLGGLALLATGLMLRRRTGDQS